MFYSPYLCSNLVTKLGFQDSRRPTCFEFDNLYLIMPFVYISRGYFTVTVMSCPQAWTVLWFSHGVFVGTSSHR